MVRTVIESAKTGDRVVRPWIGLVGQDVDNDLSQGLGLARPGGVVVTRVYGGGPADQAGIRKGDVILAVNDRAVDDLQSLRFRVATGALGGRSKVKLWRNEAPAVVSLPLEPAPETPPRNQTELSDRHPLAGATVANLSPALAEELDLLGAWEGVIVTGIRRGSPARRFRFRPGDVILAVNGEAVETVAGLRAVLTRQDQSWTISFNRKGRRRTIEITG